MPDKKDDNHLQLMFKRNREELEKLDNTKSIFQKISEAQPNLTKKEVQEAENEYRKILPYGGYCYNPECNCISVGGSTEPTCSCGWKWNSLSGGEK